MAFSENGTGNLGAAWSPDYNSGIQLIDEQHQEICRHMDCLRQLVQAGADQPELEAGLLELLELSRRHFSTEEAQMARVGYPDLAAHAAKHLSMIASLEQLAATFREGRQSMALMMPTFLEGWLRHHMSDMDYGFVTYLKSRNLA